MAVSIPPYTPFKEDRLVAKDLNLNLNQRPGELSHEMFYKITMKYEKLFD